MRKIIPLYTRAWSKVKIDDENKCWFWTGAKNKSNHGHIITSGRGSKFIQAHRAIYESIYGHVPSNLKVCHSCDNGLCCNPNHLWVGTQKDNLIDMASKLRSTCKLNKEQVILIRELWGKKLFSRDMLSEEFFISKSQINNILSRKQWAWC